MEVVCSCSCSCSELEAKNEKAAISKGRAVRVEYRLWKLGFECNVVGGEYCHEGTDMRVLACVVYRAVKECLAGGQPGTAQDFLRELGADCAQIVVGCG